MISFFLLQITQMLFGDASRRVLGCGKGRQRDGWGAYVRPVDRLTPARKAETVAEVSPDVLYEEAEEGGNTQDGIKCQMGHSAELECQVSSCVLDTRGMRESHTTMEG